MKSFQIVTLFCLIAASMAFAPNKAPQVAQRIVESGFDMKKAAIAAIPVAAIATPAFAMDSIIESLPTQTLALEVQFGAYLAVLLGTLLPVLFLINLYVQTESRKAGRDGGQDAE
ncbi:hypothetical protein ACHAXH_004930 [Discostella pseudostelligera]